MGTPSNTEITSESSGNFQTRRADLDWLRVIATLLLFPFHTAMIFQFWVDNYVLNNSLSLGLSAFVTYLDTWHMPLFFFLAGAGSNYSLRHRTGKEYLAERSKRLLIPFIFGLLLFVPPQQYFALRFHSGFKGTFWESYLLFFTIGPSGVTGFTGYFSLSVLWFLLVLFVLSAVALPVFLKLGHSKLNGLENPQERFFLRKGAIYLPALLIAPLTSITVVGKPIFVYLVVFFLGYILINEEITEKIAAQKWISLGCSLALSVVPLYVKMTGNLQDWQNSIIDALFYGFSPWFTILAILGISYTYLNRQTRVLQYLNEAALPYYIIHQTFIVAIGYYVVTWQTSIPVKFLIILSLACVCVVVTYEVFLKRPRVTRFILGMKLAKKMVSNEKNFSEEPRSVWRGNNKF